jgi:hypothetical protein
MKSKQNQTQKEQSNRERTSTQEKMVAELIAQQQSKVTLNVGGKFFDTSVSTLTKFPESMFSAMFSGRYTLKAEDVCGGLPGFPVLPPHSLTLYDI